MNKPLYIFSLEYKQIHLKVHQDSQSYKLESYDPTHQNLVFNVNKIQYNRIVTKSISEFFRPFLHER
jgi:hypothetical protein